MNIPMPLRVPELAPSLGRVIVARRREPPWVPLDDIREELATAVLELAGEGRAAFGSGLARARRGGRGRAAPLDSRNRSAHALAAGLVARRAAVGTDRRRAHLARPRPRRLSARPRMARATPRLLALVVGVVVAPLFPAAAQLRMVEVPIGLRRGRATRDSLARLGFEVAGVREINGALYAVIVVSPATQGAARP